MPESDSRSRPLSRVFWALIILVHVIAAALWWWASPAGFPVGHPRFWLHRVVPWILVGFALAWLVPRSRPLRPALVAAIPSTYLAAAIAGRLLFPITLRTLWLAPLAIGVVLGAIWALEHRAHARRAAWGAIAGVVLGGFLAFAQVAPPPSTHPANDRADVADEVIVPLAFTAGSLSITLVPELAFISRSPDGCWTVLAPRTAHRRPPDERAAMSSHVDERGALHADVHALLPRPVYSHLSSYSVVNITGHRRLFVAFSPAPEVRVEVTKHDYPTGRPARFAYVDAERVFHVVEASNAEKGPFTELARGALPPSAPLAITLYDEGTPLARVTFDDFAAQASTDLSPTAGWNVPQNALELSRWGEAPSSPATIFVTLAGTSVGRGFESVAHAAGVYRNRVHVERLAAP